VEATIFQYSFHIRNNKTRYRGLIKHKLFAFAKCLWMNLSRITNHGDKNMSLIALIGALQPILLLKSNRSHININSFKSQV
jgi:hypothetical protein